MLEEVAVKRPVDALDQDLASTLDTGSSSSCLSFYFTPIDFLLWDMASFAFLAFRSGG